MVHFIKRLLSVFFSLAVLFISVYAGFHSSVGDCNNNGVTDSNDYLLIRQNQEKCAAGCDLNGNGVIDAHDAALLRYYYLYGTSDSVFEPNALPVYYEAHDSYVIVNAAYSESADISVSVGIQTANDFPDYRYISLIADTDSSVTSITTGGKTIYRQGTDFFAPYTVTAFNGADGDVYTKKAYTGGNHLDENGNHTGQNLFFRAYADGILLKDGDCGYTTSVTFSWSNSVQAWNTVKADGTGRSVLREDVDLVFDGSRWELHKEITALEDIGIHNHHGLQFSLKYVSKKDGCFLFEGSEASPDSYPVSEVVSSYTYANDKNATSILIYDSNNAARFGIYEDGLGDFLACTSISSNCYASTSKLYFNLIYNSKGYSLMQGESVSFSGYYCFFPSNDIRTNS